MNRIALALCAALVALSCNAGDSTTLGALPAVNPRIVTEGTACSGTGLQGMNTAGLILSCQSGVWTRPLNAARFDNNAGTVKYWCTLQGADIGMMYYDYIRYAITCGGRFCLGVNQVFGTRYQFGLITEIGPGFNYTTPYNTPDSTGVTITC
ncbi:hypothetical protein ACK21T_004646, partial [Pseudomonas aeruginosa]